MPNTWIRTWRCSSCSSTPFPRRGTRCKALRRPAAASSPGHSRVRARRSGDRRDCRGSREPRACATRAGSCATPARSAGSSKAEQRDASVSELPAGELQEHVFKVRRTVEVAQLLQVREAREEGCRIGSVTEHCRAAFLQARGELSGLPVRPIHDTVAVRFDHVRLDVTEDELARAPLGDEAPAVHDGEARAQPLGFLHEVGGEHDGLPLCEELLQTLPDEMTRLRIEPGGGFVMKIRSGSLMRARARVRRRFIPPESVWIRDGARAARPAKSSRGGMRSRMVRSARPKYRP